MGTLKRAVVLAAMAVCTSLAHVAGVQPDAIQNGYQPRRFRNRQPTKQPNKQQTREHNRKSNKAARKARAKHRSK
jgi:hypothetical protein